MAKGGGGETPWGTATQANISWPPWFSFSSFDISAFFPFKYISNSRLGETGKGILLLSVPYSPKNNKNQLN